MCTQNVYIKLKHKTCTNGGEYLDKQAIAERLVKLRGKKSRETVAKACGISISALAMYEQGERIPRDDIKAKLSKYYRKSVNFIFFGQ